MSDVSSRYNSSNYHKDKQGFVRSAFALLSLKGAFSVSSKLVLLQQEWSSFSFRVIQTRARSGQIRSCFSELLSGRCVKMDRYAPDQLSFCLTLQDALVNTKRKPFDTRFLFCGITTAEHGCVMHLPAVYTPASYQPIVVYLLCLVLNIFVRCFCAKHLTGSTTKQQLSAVSVFGAGAQLQQKGALTLLFSPVQ